MNFTNLIFLEILLTLCVKILIASSRICVSRIFLLFLLFLLIMVRTRSGARTSVLVKKASKKKIMTKKDVKGETNMHNIRVMGMTSGRGANGQSGGVSPKVIPTRKRNSPLEKPRRN